ncbi:hypothetical protein AB0I84_23265 [Streptomyces spectabilis]|uniref:hypothetical protein n=1 Tax=Streptomyces spectabilis TaxID=68270 RepID=UPI0033DBC60E
MAGNRDLIAWVQAMNEPGHSYPDGLPAELEPWHFYTSAWGHALLVVHDTGTFDHAAKQQMQSSLVIAPVKAVTRAGWRIIDGIPVSALPYLPGETGPESYNLPDDWEK